jgi:uncharacterized membrane protein YhaH (DUF805 family)
MITESSDDAKQKAVDDYFNPDSREARLAFRTWALFGCCMSICVGITLSEAFGGEVPFHVGAVCTIVVGLWAMANCVGILAMSYRRRG